MIEKSVTFVTPSFSKDYERFCLQRESIERCGIDIPHVAIVHDEDVKLFENIPHRKNLRIVSTRELLSPHIEARRRMYGVRRRNPKRWFVRQPIHGWGTQQLAKLSAHKVTDTEGIVCLDSDAFFVAKVEASDFYTPNGRLHLYETKDDLDAEMAEWPAHSMRFLGVKPTHKPIMRYTHCLAMFQRRTLIDMLEFIEERYNKPWDQAIVAGDMIMEYTTYGVYAREIDKLKNVEPVAPSLTLNYWWPEQTETAQSDFLSRLEASQAKAVLINSNTGFSADNIRALIEQAWTNLASQK